MELQDKDSTAFEDILTFLQRHPEIEKWEMNEEPVISLPGLEIYPDRRKIYRNRQEIRLTTKEYDLLSFLAANKERVLTYEQIYQKVWGEDSFGNETNVIGCHIRKLREKLYEASPEAPFAIRCVREVGYTFEIKTE